MPLYDEFGPRLYYPCCSSPDLSPESIGKVPYGAMYPATDGISHKEGRVGVAGCGSWYSRVGSFSKGTQDAHDNYLSLCAVGSW